MEGSGKKSWLYGVIALLLLALVIETGFLILKATARHEEKTRRAPAIQNFSYPAQVSNVTNYQPRRASHGTRPSPSFLDEWDPFEEMENMQKQMNRIFDESFGRALRSPMTQGPAASQSGSLDFPAFSPAIDVKETQNAYIAKADLPGLDKDKIDANVSGNVLTISGKRRVESEKEDAQQGFYASERGYGSFSRSVTLPGPVDQSGIIADYKNGVLTVTLPRLKGAESSKRRVAIN